MKTLVESCFHLDTKLLKKDLRKARQKEPVEEYLNFLFNGKPSVLDYRIEYEDNQTYLVVSFGVEPQKFLLSEQELIFGNRTYFVCGCGKRTTALYLNKGIFACRKCHNLCYQSTTINSATKHGRFIYQQSQILKIMEMRENMGRIFYRSQYSKRFMRWLDLCARVGLTKEVEDAKNLMFAINNYQQNV